MNVLKVLNSSIPEPLFSLVFSMCSFSLVRVLVESFISQVFFRLEIRRRGEGDWTCCAANLHFHEQDREKISVCNAA